MKNIRKTLRSLHRDFGYFVVGITFIYTISGIALNHRTDWNPHYILVTEDITIREEVQNNYSKEDIDRILKKFESEPIYKKHFATRNNEIKIFIEEGTVVVNDTSRTAHLEVLKKRPFFYHINKLHLAKTDRLWVWISDLMAFFLLFVAVSGLFLLKGKYGLQGRGWWLTALGFAIPLLVILFYII
jgi:hypothetical protein